jgi:glucose-1-phosphate cytidylyltransferase
MPDSGFTAVREHHDREQAISLTLMRHHLEPIGPPPDGGSGLKVVIFCGGLGVRMGEETLRIPKPMIHVGNRPMLWHIMRYYAGWGHKDFVLCLGYKGEVIKEYFLNHDEALTSDFVLDGRASRNARVELLARDSDDWRITFLDTGIQSTIAERLLVASQYIEDDVFLATYGDGVTDAPLPTMIDALTHSDKLAVFLSVRPEYSGHIVTSTPDGTVTGIQEMSRSDVRMNGGFFVLRREILDHIRPGDELVDETFARLIPDGLVGSIPYDGFFGPMDTIKDRQRLETLLESGAAPWLVRSRERQPVTHAA